MGEDIVGQGKKLGAQAQGLARDANDHPVLRVAARVGYAASGLVHLLIAWAALGIAWAPAQQGTADQSGAIGALARMSWGGALLWVLVVGFAGLALWQLTESIGGYHGRGRDALFGRVKALGKAVAYLALGVTAYNFAHGAGSDSRSQSTEFTKELLASTGGQVLVAAIALGTLGVGVYHVHKGLTRSFVKDLVEHPGEIACRAGVFGYSAKGVALGIVGLLFMMAALTADSSRASGLDGALRALAATPYGTLLLTAVALGLAAYGVYSFFRARYTRL